MQLETDDTVYGALIIAYHLVIFSKLIIFHLIDDSTETGVMTCFRRTIYK